MGLFDRFLNINRRADVDPVCEPMHVYAPVSGDVLPLPEFPDPVFSQGILGQGIGIDPSEGRIYAPADGEISTAPSTGHAVGLESGGMDILIHVGVDTVEMGGKGFSMKVSTGQKVRKGDLLLSFDRKAVEAAGHPCTVAVVVTNSEDLGDIGITDQQTVPVGGFIFHFGNG